MKRPVPSYVPQSRLAPGSLPNAFLRFFRRLAPVLTIPFLWLGLAVGAQAQVTWAAETAAEANQWYSVTYGNGLFVAVSQNGTHRVMTSPDGITWTAQMAAETNTWRGITYGNGLFVAVSSNGTHRVMTSPDGVTWTAQTAAETNPWTSVTYGNGLFVATTNSGTHRVMTSPDGVTWTAQTAAEANSWNSVTYGNGKFVAVASDGTHRVMTSPDGVTWTAQTAAEANFWQPVTYGNGKFVALASNGTHRVMTSPDGVTWTVQTATEANLWQSIIYANNVFVAVSQNGTNRVMTSPDGVTWTAQTATEANTWTSVTYGNGKFVAVSYDGTHRVMISASPLPVALLSFTAKAQPDNTILLNWKTAAETSNDFFQLERSKDLIQAQLVAQVSAVEGATQGHTYSFTDTQPIPGTSYYRLRQVDLDGTTTTYPWVSVVLDNQAYGVFPNPVSQPLFSLHLDEPETAQIGLFSVEGKPIPFQKGSAQNGNLQLKVGQSLPAGMYILKVEERAQARQHRLVVE